MTELINTLLKYDKIDEEMHKKVLNFIEENRFEPTAPLNSVIPKKTKVVCTFSPFNSLPDDKI